MSTRWIASAIFLLLLPSFAKSIVLRFQEPGPKGVISISNAELCWQIWTEPATVPRIYASIDNTEVDGRYSQDTRAVLVKAPDLVAGKHRAFIQVSFSGFEPVSREWDFDVPNVRIQLPNEASVIEASLLWSMNALRRSHGLPNVAFDPSLSAAARSHARYLGELGALSHHEERGRAGYVGDTPTQQAMAFGFQSGVSQVVSHGTDRPDLSVQSLFDAPYHRLSILDPRAARFGGALEDRITVMDFDVAACPATIVLSPPPNARNVPASWDGAEAPDPLRGTNLAVPVGYPIVIAVYGEAQNAFFDNGFLLDSALRAVPLIVRTPQTDVELASAAILIPQIPLGLGRTYQAHIDVLRPGRSPEHIAWSFTTRSERDTLKR